MIYFLNSTDRVYDDNELNRIAGVLFDDGVFNTKSATRNAWELGGDFFVQASGAGMNVTAKPGLATMQVVSGGKAQQIFIDEAIQLACTVSDNVTLAVRSDAVVLRVDQSVIDGDGLNIAGDNAVSLVAISGNSANILTDAEISTALGGDGFVRLANIAVPLGAGAITQAMLTDYRTLSKMTRAVSVGSDTFQFFALSDDPATLEAGMVWFNQSEGILKMFDGTNTIALQTQDFNWGYYPPNGIDENSESFEPVAENDSVTGVTNNVFYYIKDLGGSPTDLTIMQGQVFTMPDVLNPFMRVKMGSPTYPVSVAFKVYTVNGSNEPLALVETAGSFTVGAVPANDYLNFYLDGSLYTPGTKYIVIAQSTQLGFVNGADADYTTGAVLASNHDADEVFVGTRSGSYVGLTTNPLTLSWSAGLSANSNWIMSIQEREEIQIGKTDISTNTHELSQVIIPKSQDIIGFAVVKGASIGTPTGDINVSLYEAVDDKVSGDVLATASITNAEWVALNNGDSAVFPLAYDELIVGKQYVVLIDCDDVSDTNNYTIYFGNLAGGTAKKFNTADGWLSINGNIFFSIYTSANRKIVVTDNQGKIPASLIPNVPPRVTTIVSSATPAYSVDTAGAVLITALAENITNMSTNMIGTPSDFQRIAFRVTASGGIRTIAWGTNFASTGVVLDTSIASGKTLTADFMWNEATSKFDLISSTETP